MSVERICQYEKCDNPVYGRADKKYCSDSHKVLANRKHSRKLTVNNSRKHPTQKTGTKAAGTSFTNNTIDVHRFFYYCNYNGLLEGKELNKHGWHQLNYKQFTTIIPTINSQLKLTKDTKLSIQFTKGENPTLALGITGHSWPSVEAMETDAYILTMILEQELNIQTDNLHREKMRTREAHIGRPDESVEEFQDPNNPDRVPNYKGKTTFNAGHWTESHPGDIQYERDVDSKRHKDFMDFIGNPVIDEPEPVARGAYEGLNLIRALSASINIQMKTQQNIEAYSIGLEKHLKAYDDLSEMAQAITASLGGGQKHKKHWKGRRRR